MKILDFWRFLFIIGLIILSVASTIWIMSIQPKSSLHEMQKECSCIPGEEYDVLQAKYNKLILNSQIAGDKIISINKELKQTSNELNLCRFNYATASGRLNTLEAKPGC